ncbi:alpha/beta hydrolase [Mycolicibacterium sp. P9-64]|uniref:alpha/beta fold hydrolase n=1 Tax=Mycolicibacterium sp. P9-64 TaxID=2024612 RepID=UPI001F5BADCB|nr:alpha/beta hydrolase [Mycolicibacterium sp. P9-64]
MPTMTLSAAGTHATVSYTDDGSGPPVLLLHAALHDRTDYTSVHGALGAGRRVIALDWPGHGESPSADDEPLGAVELGDLAVEFADRLDLSNVVVVGNSIGGYAACRLAIERPGRVAGVVLVNTGGFTPPTAVIRAFCAVMGRPWVIRSGASLFVRAYMHAKTPAECAMVSRVVARAHTTSGSRTAAALWRSFTEPGHDLRDRAAGITAPVLITWGTKDPTATTKWGRAVQAAIPGSTFVGLSTGHVVFAGDPDGWLNSVLPFVESAHSVDRPATRG